MLAYKAFLTPRNIVLLIVCLGVPGYCYVKGRADGREKEAREHADVRMTQLFDSSKTLGDVEAKQTVRAIEAKDDATKARSAHAKAAARVVIVGNEIAIDGAAPSSVVAAAPVAREISSARDALAADSLALLALTAVVATTKQEVRIESERADVAEKRSRPRFGFRSGAVVGLIAAVGLRLLLR